MFIEYDQNGLKPFQFTLRSSTGVGLVTITAQFCTARVMFSALPKPKNSPAID